MARKIALDRSEIVSGRPLPFSVFDPARNLLLAAKGQIVTDSMRAVLLRNGLAALVEDDEPGGHGGSGAANDEVPMPLHHLRLQYSRASAMARWGFRISRDERSDSYTCRAIGITERRGLILTAPAREDRSFVAISEGQTWLFRTFYATAAIRFTGIIEKVVFDPFPYFHVEVPAVVEMRHVRKMQRVATCTDATLDLDTPTEAVIVDLSSTGLRIAVHEAVKLSEGQNLKIHFRLTLLEQTRDMHLDATVVRCLGNADSQHPQVSFYGLLVQPQSDVEQLILHSYVQGCVIHELDALSKMLAN
jgi:hypothetical protein